MRMIVHSLHTAVWTSHPEDKLWAPDYEYMGLAASLGNLSKSNQSWNCSSELKTSGRMKCSSDQSSASEFYVDGNSPRVNIREASSIKMRFHMFS